MKRFIPKLILLLVGFLVLCAETYAQCSMCKGAVAGSQEVARAASQINLAVLVLLVPPVAIFVGIFGMSYRFRNIQGGSDRGERREND